MDISELDSDDLHFEDILIQPADPLEGGLSLTEKLGARLGDQLLQFHGCCRECHYQASQEHADKFERHYSLQEFIAEAGEQCPDVLSSNKVATFQDSLGSSITTAQKRWTYSGVHPARPEEGPAHICLQKDEAPCQTTRATFDIDSITGFCSSLGVARGGIRWNFMQMPVSDLQSGLHLAKQRVQYFDSHGHLHSIQKPVHEIPHYTLGRLVGFEDVSLYLLFPRLVHEEQQSSRLLNHDFETWLDQVLLPAIHQCHDGGQLQHYPSSY